MITMTAYIILSLSLAICLEALVGNFAVVIPFTALVLFYFSVSGGWYLGIAAGAATGLLIDILYGRDLIISPFLLMAVAVIANIWITRKEAKSIFMHGLPGALTAAVYVIPLVLASIFSPGISFSTAFRNISTVIFAILVSAMLLPMIIIFFDYIGSSAGFTLYQSVKNKFDKRHKGAKK